MGGQQAELSGPDFSQGISVNAVSDGRVVLGHAQGEAVILTRQGDAFFALSANCTHYGASLADGLVVEGTIRCPMHHAAFSLKTGQVVRAPSLNGLSCFQVERRGDSVYVVGRREVLSTRPAVARAPSSVVIVGAGAAGNAAAETLRREGYDGPILMFGAEESVPYDRPNLSKDYLAGTAPEEWIPLRSSEFYQEQKIQFFPNTRIAAIDSKNKRVTTEKGDVHPYGALLLATGAEPIKLPIPGAQLPHVHTLRTLADTKAIIAKLPQVKRAVVLGASFIGLEVAASLRTRGLEVHVVAPEARPLERVLGAEVGDFVRALHEEKGVVFHLGQTARSTEEKEVVLQSGEKLSADLVVMGVGVRPSLGLAEAAGLAMEGGVRVNELLETSAEGIYAAGDIARFPHFSGEKLRIEHWVVAQRQGQTAARNMLGRRERYEAVPFFWSMHYDVRLSYVGHAQGWDQLERDGEFATGSFTLKYKKAGRVVAVLTAGRDPESLAAELALEREPRRTS